MATTTAPGSAVVRPVASGDCATKPCTTCRDPASDLGSGTEPTCGQTTYGPAPADYPTICEDCCDTITLAFPAAGGGGGTEERTLGRNASWNFPCGSVQGPALCVWSGSGLVSSGTGLPTVRWVATITAFLHGEPGDPADGQYHHSHWLYKEWETTTVGGGCTYRLRRAVYVDADTFDCPSDAAAGDWADWPGLYGGASYTEVPDESGTTVSDVLLDQCVVCDDGGV
jgi:hypothetical protein